MHGGRIHRLIGLAAVKAVAAAAGCAPPSVTQPSGVLDSIIDAALKIGTVPTAYQQLVVAAGKVCPGVSAPLIAAQIEQVEHLDPAPRLHHQHRSRRHRRRRTTRHHHPRRPHHRRHHAPRRPRPLARPGTAIRTVHRADPRQQQDALEGQPNSGPGVALGTMTAAGLGYARRKTRANEHARALS